MAIVQQKYSDVRSTPARPEWRSHSQLNTYLQCPREWQLGKGLRIPRRPGCWFPGGTTVHRVIELYLRDSLTGEGNDE
jgi:PD-(D/E)XK nuclease superfamily protein